MAVLYLARETPVWGALEGKDTMSPAAPAARHPPAHPVHAGSLQHQDRRSAPSSPPSCPASGAGAGTRPRWWEVPRAAAPAPSQPSCPGVGGPERQPRGSHPAQTRRDKHSESGIATAKRAAQGRGIHSALFSILNSKENQGMELKSHNGNVIWHYVKVIAIPSLVRLVILFIPRHR